MFQDRLVFYLRNNIMGNIMDKLIWLEEVKSNIPSFLKKLKVDNTGFYKFSIEGDIYGPECNWGLGQAVYASKLYYMLNDPILLSQNQDQLSNFILKFSKPDGMIYDSFISQKSFFKRIKNLFFKRDFGNIFNAKTNLAETRQAYAALMCLGNSPTDRIRIIKPEEDFFEDYLNKLDWTHPYAAGSHFSHLLYFLQMEKSFFNLSSSKYEKLLSRCFIELDCIKNNDGFWYETGVTDVNQIINGAMKIMTGLKIIDSLDRIESPSSIIDLCLETKEFHGGCDNLDRLYVLYHCKKLSNHRSEEVMDFAIKQIEFLKDSTRFS